MIKKQQEKSNSHKNRVEISNGVSLIDAIVYPLVVEVSRQGVSLVISDSSAKAFRNGVELDSMTGGSLGVIATVFWLLGKGDITPSKRLVELLLPITDHIQGFDRNVKNGAEKIRRYKPTCADFIK